MEEEIVVIVRKQANRSSDATEGSAELERVFRGPDRYKKAAKFIRALKDVEET